MKSSIRNSFLIAIVLFLLSGNQIVVAQSCFELVWSDEFNIPGKPDSTKWTYEVGNNNGNNHESQYYTKRIENARIEDSALIIEARKETYSGFQYTSARINTYSNNLYWKYGKIVARMKLPYGQGIWPAFWMLGNSIFTGTNWPACGEIDIMELVGGGEGRDDKAYGTPHWADANNNHAQYGGAKQLSEGIYADAYHTFSVEWNATTIKWFMDGQQFHVIDITPAALSEFKNNFFIILNLAVGGDWPGYPNASTVFPQKFYIDYVRVYQLNKTPEIKGESLVVKAEKSLKFSTVESNEFTYQWSVPEDAQIISGQGTHSIDVNWGCTSGSVTCNLITNCDNYNLEFPVLLNDLIIIGKEQVKENELNIYYSIPQTLEASYAWTLPEAVSSTTNLDTNAVFLNWGTKDGTLKVMVDNTCGFDSASIDVSILRQLPYPNAEEPHVIPGTIESVYYDMGGEGIAYHDKELKNLGTGIRLNEGVDTEANDGGYNVGWTEPGEWLEYTISIASSKKYDAEIRIASPNTTGKFKILFNGEDRTGTISVSNSGGWAAFKSIFLNDIQLYDTDTLMRISIVSSGFNLGRLIFADSITNDIHGMESATNINIYPTITDGKLYVQNLNNQTGFTIIDIAGIEVKKGIVEPNSSIDVTSFYPGSYFIIIDEPNSRKAHKFIKIQ
ncbi:MAG: family 16 glycosylhydrolase [Salinivirgaceae bacterium]